MKTETEIRRAIADMEPCLRENAGVDRAFAQITIDILKWVIDLPSVAHANIEALRKIRIAAKQ
jgi:hypothetical protein